MQKKSLLNIAKLRLSVGALGEEKENAWWNSSFFSPNSQAFLSPVFGRTVLMAKYYGVKEAASRVHDEFIGIGSGVFHLFRLPEAVEKELHNLLEDGKEKEELKILVADMDSIRQFLLEMSGSNGGAEAAVGPIRIGTDQDLTRGKPWQQMAALYASAAKAGNKVFPYFSKTNE